jgi:hypothetical protein
MTAGERSVAYVVFTSGIVDEWLPGWVVECPVLPASVGVERARVSWSGWLVGTLLGPEGSGRHARWRSLLGGVGVGVVWLFGSSL